jgi:hypothetical protein
VSALITFAIAKAVIHVTVTYRTAKVTGCITCVVPFMRTCKVFAALITDVIFIYIRMIGNLTYCVTYVTGSIACISVGVGNFASLTTYVTACITSIGIGVSNCTNEVALITGLITRVGILMCTFCGRTHRELASRFLIGLAACKTTNEHDKNEN